MTTATKEKQTLLQEFGVKYEAVQKLADTIEIHHQKAYTEAALKNLKDKEGNLDYKLLKNADVRSAMAGQMSDYYVEKAKEYFKIDDKASKLSDMQKEMLMSAYAGITQGELTSVVHKLEDEFTLNKFQEMVSKIKENVRGKLMPSSYSHVKDTSEHKKKILKDIGLEGKLDAELIPLDELVPLMEAYHVNSVVPPKRYEKHPAYIALQKKQPAAAGAHH